MLIGTIGFDFLVRPGFQSTLSHSRLVTTKLTASSPAATPTPGWSRPNSAAPSAPSQTAQSGTMNSSSQAQARSSNRNALNLSQAGSIAKSDGGSRSLRPVWRNLPGGARTNSGAQQEFPTAAEAAKGTKI